jgi:hypothetical protein
VTKYDVNSSSISGSNVPYDAFKEILMDPKVDWTKRYQQAKRRGRLYPGDVVATDYFFESHFGNSNLELTFIVKSYYKDDLVKGGYLVDLERPKGGKFPGGPLHPAWITRVVKRAKRTK